MSRYDSIDCPICGKPLDNGDEIVVCPDCGAPYHRTCYLEKGHCIYPELHERGEAWSAPKKEEKFDGSASLRCSRCGTLNPSYGIFCQVCGNKLSDSPVPGQDDSQQTGQPMNGWNVPPQNPQNPGNPPNSSPYGQWNIPPQQGGFPPGMPLNPYTTPFGGVAPDEEIDGVPAKDLAIFVGRNTHYFLPRFKEITQTKARIINWSGFFFKGGYFLFRKMYLVGILFFLADLILAIPNALILMQSLTTDAAIMDAATTATMSTLSTINLICSFLSLGLRFLCGFLANSLYKGHCKKKILAEQQVQRTPDEYYAVLSKKGGVATKLIMGLLIGYAVLNLFSLYFMMMFGY